MRKNLFYAGTLFCTMSLLASCNNDDLSASLQQDGNFSVTASMGMQSRTTVEEELNAAGEYDIVWSAGDGIYLYGGDSYSWMTLTEGVGHSEAEFNGRIYGYASQLTNAIYPKPSVNGDGTFGLELKSAYDYSANSNAPMYGNYADGNVSFSLLTAMMRVNVDVEAGDVVTLIMKGADGQAAVIAGEVTIADGEIEMETRGDETVKVTFKNSGNYMLDIPVPAGTYSGYTVKLGNEVIAEKTFEAVRMLEAGQIAVASSIEAPETPADATEIIITTAAQLRWFAEQVNTGNTFAGKTIKLDANIDLKNVPWIPVGNGAEGAVSFRGTFDGQENTVSNVMINEDASAYDGFFGSVWGATIQNLKLEGVSVETGRLVARANGDVASSTTIVNNVVVNGSSANKLFDKMEKDAIIQINGEKHIAEGVTATMDETKYNLNSVDGMFWFAQQVSGKNTFNNKTVALANDINLSDIDWEPIGTTGLFYGTFDGNEKTILNLKVVAEGKAAAGLFASSRGVIKNVILENVNVTGNYKSGAILGDGLCSRIENCHVNGGTITSKPYNKDDANNVGGIVGYLSAEPTAYVKDCSVDGLTITAYRKVAGIVGAANGANAEVLNNEVSNTTIIADQTDEYYEVKAPDAGKIVGWNGMNIDLSSNTDNNVIIEVKINDADGLVAALENGEDVTLYSDIKIDPANMSNAYGTTGINVKEGQTIDGNGYTLNIKGADDTWDTGINTTGGLIKDITVTGSFRGIFINHNSTHSEKVILENVTITGTVYTISCDQGLNQGFEATGCTFNGWTSYAATIGNVKFTNCNFNEGSGYAYCRPYAPTEFINCNFEKGYQMDTRNNVTFKNCKLDGVLLTEENLSTLVTSNITNAKVIE